MRFTPANLSRAQGGYGLMVVLVFSGISLLLLSAALEWTATSARLSARQNHYFAMGAAAEAATEKVLAAMGRDYLLKGEAEVYGRLGHYRKIALAPGDEAAWANYQFINHVNQNYRTEVTRLEPWDYRSLNLKYTGWSGYSARYVVAVQLASAGAEATPVQTGVRQEIQLAALPLFQFALFYAGDLELHPNQHTVITGPVHSNGSIYSSPNGATVTFQGPVTASGNIVLGQRADDPVQRQNGQVVFGQESEGAVRSLLLPLGTNNTAERLHAVIEIPAASESRTSLPGQQRYYHKAELIIRVSDAGTTATSGAYNDFSIVLPAALIQSMLRTDVSFFDKRESKTVQAAELNIGHLLQAYGTLTVLLGREVRCLYLADLRTASSQTLAGVRLIDGQTLPALGLTVATPNPLYVLGHYNAPSLDLGTTNTTGTAPASLIADAITVLSGNWSDGNSVKPVEKFRQASDTTINAAIIAGIVPTGGGYYSGGVENFLRLLEDWSIRTLTFNGSIVALYPSQSARAPWGTTAEVYRPPFERRWSWDPRLAVPATMPPGTPQCRTLFRSEWKIQIPNES